MTSEEPFEFGKRPRSEPEAVEEVEVEELEAEVEEAEEPAEAPTSARSARVSVGAWLALVAALVAVVLAFVAWRDAGNNPDRVRADARDQAVIEGINAIEVMNTMDFRDVDAGVTAWQGVSTGLLRDQLMVIDDAQRDLIVDQGKVATGRVVKAALTEITDRTATLIAAVEVTVRDGEADPEPAVKRNRYSADLVLVDGHWKLEDLQPVAVNL